ncbi:MAG TPA: DUF501 domain-containing protein [Acidimicrobiales bacterium]|nr:DUF501 domain-containing protein [Acidimicrobiales bacterium]
MSVAAVVLGPGRSPERSRGGGGRPGSASVAAVAASAAAAGYDELIVLVAEESEAVGLPESATVLVDHSHGGAAAALRVAIDWAQREGHDALTVALPVPPGRAAAPETEASAWRALLSERAHPVVVATSAAGRSGLVRLAAEIWALAPLEGDPALLLGARPELVEELAAVEEAPPTPTAEEAPPTPTAEGGEERALIASLLGREPAGAYRVAVRGADGRPIVIENAPFLDDGTPMPTSYWLVGRREAEAVGRLEAAGGVRRATAAVPAALVEAAHARHAAARDATIPAAHRGPRPSGGVGGTRVGVKCLHAHLAWYLAGGADPVGRWVADELRGELTGPVAAIDCGTNSTRLLIVAPDGTTLEREMTITRLGEGVDRTGRLSEEAIARTLAALRAYRALMDHHGVVAQRAAATSAARDAANAEEFFAAAAEVLGRAPELLAGEEEGRLSYAGATAGLDPAEGPFVVVDLGGGSTELVAAGEDPEHPVAVSLDLGCVRVTERFFTSDPPGREEVAAARHFVADEAGAALVAAPALGTARRCIGVAGTVSTLVQLAIGLAEYDRAALHHRLISRREVEELATALLAEPVAARRARPGIEAGRADVIAAGALIFGEVMAVLGHDEARYSESDILDGIAAGLLAATA